MLKHAVSKKKCRFIKDGFDLDLTYIRPNIIAMGFPSSSLEGVYRNHLPDVQRFFRRYHPGKFKIYNLCSERGYDAAKFDNKVEKFPFDDHNPPPFALISKFCQSVDSFLKEDPEHVVAIHCKAGKGRTGMMIACYLLHCGVASTAAEALEIFGNVRTANGKGVTIPSQRHYCQYYERFLKQKNLNITDPPAVYLHRIRMWTAPNFDVGGGCDPYVKVIDIEGDVKAKTKHIRYKEWKGAEYVDLDCKKTKIVGDMRIELWDWDSSVDDKICQVWVHSAFLRSHECFHKNDVDGPQKKDDSDKFHQDFRLEFFFDESNPVNVCPVHGTAPILEVSEEEEENEEMDQAAIIQKQIHHVARRRGSIVSLGDETQLELRERKRDVALSANKNGKIHDRFIIQREDDGGVLILC